MGRRSHCPGCLTLQEALPLHDNGEGEGGLDLGDDGTSQVLLEVCARWFTWCQINVTELNRQAPTSG